MNKKSIIVSQNYTFINIMLAKLFITYASLAVIKSAKILVVVPTPSLSHQMVFRPLIQELIHRNHQVLVITTDPVYKQGKAPNNLTEIDLHDLSYGLWNKMLFDTLKTNGDSDSLTVMSAVYRVCSEVLEQQLRDKSVQKLLKDKTVKFDLLIIEACTISALIFSHIFKAPVIHMSSFGANPGFMDMIGAETHPLLFPTHYHERIYNLTIWDKINELYNHGAFDWMIKKQEHHDEIMLQRLFGIDVPFLNELKNNVHVLSLNIHPLLVHHQPVPPNVIYTSAIHKTPGQILPKDLQYYLDSSKHGVIYVSFGTNVKSSLIASEKLKIFLKVFSRLPYNILWKWDLEELPGKSQNIKISKWFPQCDVLRHPNFKLFITQGGLQSTDEAINAGVPLIGIPVYTDQKYNTAKYEHFKIGIQLNFKSLTIENFENAIKTILTDDSYRKNIISLRRLIHDQRKPPLENAIWWINYVLRHGGARHLRTPAANMTWSQYYELELVFVILSGFTAVVIVLLLSMYFCFKCLHAIVYELIKL